MSRPPVDNKINVQEFQDYWRKIRERTSSSPSGRHFGQWKAIAKSDYLSAIFTKLTSLPVESGFHPNQLCQRLECSLEKKDKRLRSDELRIINLLEADYNQCLKLIFGKRMMRNAEFSNEFPTSQFGSKRGSRAIEAVRVKRMTLDIIRLNRLVHMVGALSTRKHGVQIEPIRILINSLQNSTNIIRTAHDDSDLSHKSTPVQPYHGTGQGSGASPAVWCAITIAIIEALLQERIGTFLTLAISLQLIRIPAILFVDDTDFIVTGDSDDNTSFRCSYLLSGLSFYGVNSFTPPEALFALINAAGLY